jgi:hypothetical protein
MIVFLICFNDIYHKELIGIYMFESFTALIRRSNFFFTYNDLHKKDSTYKKKGCFKIITHKLNKITNNENR